MPGRINQTPGVATDGSLVAVSWTAIGPDSLADAYVAVSYDAGATFGSPVRVNDIAGEVRASEQQAPRIAIGAGSIAVLWTSRREAATQIRLAVSTDGGRSFAPSQSVSAAGAIGTRGWGSLIMDAQRRVHVLWLDTRLSASGIADANAPNETGAAHMHGGVAKAETRQDVYKAVITDAGVVTESLVATGVCFCCKTAIALQGQSVWGAWRDVYPGSLRDITFARIGGDDLQRTRVSEDNWQIEGCPEDGPSLAASAGRIDIVWPTMVTSGPLAKGVFYASTSDGRAFSARVRLDAGVGSVSHPAIATRDGSVTLAVWEVSGSGGARIQSRELSGATWGPIRVLDSGATAASPAVAALQNGFVAAWGRRADAASTIEVVRISSR